MSWDCLYSAIERDVIARTTAVPIDTPMKDNPAIDTAHIGHPPLAET